MCARGCSRSRSRCHISARKWKSRTRVLFTLLYLCNYVKFRFNIKERASVYVCTCIYIFARTCEGEFSERARARVRRKIKEREIRACGRSARNACGAVVFFFFPSLFKARCLSSFFLPIMLAFVVVDLMIFFATGSVTLRILKR